MISYFSNLNMNTANIILNKYISLLIHEIEQNNFYIDLEIDKVHKLNLSQTDYDYIYNLLNEMKLTNNNLIYLLQKFNNEFVDFINHNIHELKYYSNDDIKELTALHIENLIYKCL